MEKCITNLNQYTSLGTAENAFEVHAERIGQKCKIIKCDYCRYWHIVPKRENANCRNHATYYINDTETGCLFCSYTAVAAYTRSELEAKGI